MLVLARRLGESLVIYTEEGLKITVVVKAFQGGEVRLGVEAPLNVHIDRKEIYLRKQAEKSPT